MKQNTIFIILFVGLILFGASHIYSQERHVVTEALVTQPSMEYSRSAVFQDSLFFSMVQEQFQTPEAGEPYANFEGATEWEEVDTGKNGYFKSKKLRDGYLYFSLHSEEPRTILLNASGHSMAFINGIPRPGDVYGYGYVKIPVKLKSGRNDFLFRVSRGRMKVNWKPAGKSQYLNTEDLTAPDLLIGKESDYWAALPVINTSENYAEDLSITCHLTGSNKNITHRLKAVTPLSVRKAAFKIPPVSWDSTGMASALLELKNGGKVIDTDTIRIDVKDSTDHHDRTFISNIDRSVQYYSVSPGSYADTVSPAMYLSLHGASVQARDQAACYPAKDDGIVIAPTNRRPYGFDWEDWGRMDAMEVLGHTEDLYGTNPRKTYLTGHSMGGHGTWQIGAQYPGRFAAIAPSSGWKSFWSYTDKDRFKNASSIEKMMLRSANPSNTLGFSENYKDMGIYILHGDSDQVVPVSQSREMRDHLADFHKDFVYFEKEGAKHWWGNQCLNWPPIFYFFRQRKLEKPENKLNINFTTASPGISHKSSWLEILQQKDIYEFSNIKISAKKDFSRFEATTDNIKMLAINLSEIPVPDKAHFMIDSQKVKNVALSAKKKVYFSNDNGTWQVVEKPSLKEKYPGRYGGFKNAFTKNVVLVYGTGGSAGADKWCYRKARYDAEKFWYRGNGALDVMPDTLFLKSDSGNRNVVLYGNASQNKAWDDVLGDCPLRVKNDKISFGNQSYTGSDMGAYFAYPRKNTKEHLVGVVSATGTEGRMMSWPNHYFKAGSGYPDVFIFNAKMAGNRFEGVLKAGYFDNNWRIKKGDFSSKQQ